MAVADLIFRRSEVNQSGVGSIRNGRLHGDRSLAGTFAGGRCTRFVWLPASLRHSVGSGAGRTHTHSHYVDRRSGSGRNSSVDCEAWEPAHNAASRSRLDGPPNILGGTKLLLGP